MPVFVPSLDTAPVRFGKIAAQRTSDFSILIERHPIYGPCFIYHRMDLTKSDFLEFPAYLFAFELIVFHPERGILAVIDDSRRASSGRTIIEFNEYDKKILDVFRDKWTVIPMEYLHISDNKDHLIDRVAKRLKELPPTGQISGVDFIAVVRHLNNQLGILALPPARFADYDDYLKHRFARAVERASVFQLLRTACNESRRRGQPISIHVRGTAGSGKTLGAADTFKRLSELGRRPLLLCYNHLLGRWMSNECNGTSGYANTLFSLAHYTLKSHGKSHDRLDADHVTILDSMLTNQQIVLSDAEKYDALIVDEGQDFREEWIPVIKYFLRSNHDLVWIEDDHQDILNSGKWRLEQFFQNRIIQRPASVRQNLRNPERIVKFGINLLERLAAMVGVENPLSKDTETVGFRGTAPRNFACSGEVDLLAKLESRITELLGLGFQSDQICIVDCRNPENGEPTTLLDFSLNAMKYRDYTLVALGRHELCRYSGAYNTQTNAKIYLPKDGGIHCDSVMKIKGLEYPAVLLVDIERHDGLPTNQWLGRIYCGLTRATASLDIFYISGHWQQMESEFFSVKAD